jgi:hypothetical protein
VTSRLTLQCQGSDVGAHRGHIASRSTRKRRESLRSQPQVRRCAVHIRGGQELPCAGPDLQADSQISVTPAKARSARRRSLVRSIAQSMEAAEALRHIAAISGCLAPSRRGTQHPRVQPVPTRQNSRFWMSAASQRIIVRGVPIRRLLACIVPVPPTPSVATSGEVVSSGCGRRGEQIGAITSTAFGCPLAAHAAAGVRRE